MLIRRGLFSSSFLQHFTEIQKLQRRQGADMAALLQVAAAASTAPLAASLHTPAGPTVSAQYSSSSASRSSTDASRPSAQTPAAHAAAQHATATHAAAHDAGAARGVILYRGAGIRLFRLLVRMKVFQLAGVAALAIPVNTFLATGSVSSTQVVMASALIVGAGAASTALWYYSRRYVGELALLPSTPPQRQHSAASPALSRASTRVRFSVLDFWGNREDNNVALQAVVPPLQHLPEPARRAMLQEPLLPVDVEGDRRYILSLRYGRVLDPATLRALLAGELEGQQLDAVDHFSSASRST